MPVCAKAQAGFLFLYQWRKNEEFCYWITHRNNSRRRDRLRRDPQHHSTKRRRYRDQRKQPVTDTVKLREKLDEKIISYIVVFVFVNSRVR